MQKKHSFVLSFLTTSIIATGLVFSSATSAQTAAQQLLKAEQEKTIQQEAEKAKAAEAAFLASPEGQAWAKEQEEKYYKQQEEEERIRKEELAAAEEIIKKEMERIEKEPAPKRKVSPQQRMAQMKAKMEARKKAMAMRNTPKSLGCFKDQSSKLPDLTGRDIDGALAAGKMNTGAKCVAFCKTKGFKYAGTQWGKYCHCGNSYGKYGPATNCNKPCTGNPNEMCGGGLANTVYDIGALTASTAEADAPIANIAASDDSAAATGATGEAKWVAGSVPAEATVGAQSGGKPVHICKTEMPNKEVHNGKAWNNSCYVGFGGKEIKTPIEKSEVLVLANTNWVEVKDGKVPENAFKVGDSGGLPMNVCRGKVPNGESHPGKLWKGNCYIGFGGKEIKTGQYEVMTVTK